MYLIFTGIEIYLVWGESLSKDVMTELFCQDEEGNFLLVEDPPEDTSDFCMKVTRLINEIRWNQPFYQPLKILRRPISTRSKDTTTQQKNMLAVLLQDAKRKKGLARGRPINEASYVDFLVLLHKTVRKRL